MTVQTLQPVLTLPVSTRDHCQGPATAPVTLVEYGDYQCPHCLRAHGILLDLMVGMEDRVRLVFRNFPLSTIHPDAQMAAEAAEAAGAQGRFWEMHDHLFEHQARLDHASLLIYAAEIGLDRMRFMRDLESHAFADRVREDFLSGVDSGVNGTPTFFMNGLRYNGAWDLEALVAATTAVAEQR